MNRYYVPAARMQDKVKSVGLQALCSRLRIVSVARWVGILELGFIDSVADSAGAG